MAARAARVTWLVAALPCVCRCKASVASSRARVCCRVCSCAACHARSGLTTATFDEWSNVSGGWGWWRCGGRGCGEAGASERESKAQPAAANHAPAPNPTPPQPPPPIPRPRRTRPRPSRARRRGRRGGGSGAGWAGRGAWGAWGGPVGWLRPALPPHPPPRTMTTRSAAVPSCPCSFSRAPRVVRLICFSMLSRSACFHAERPRACPRRLDRLS